MDSLVEAKREFLYKLCSVMIPHMNMAFYKLYVDAEAMCKGYQPLIQFQKLLKEIPHWNNSLVKDRTNEITKEFPMFNKLVNITQVSFIKIMLSVRLTGEKRKISIPKLSSEDFVHECYKEAAEELYRDPKIFMKNVSEYDREADLTARFSVCIKNAMDEKVPIYEILSNLMNDDLESYNFHEGDPEPDDPEPEPMLDQLAEQPGVPEPPEVTEQPMSEQPMAVPAEQTKNIQLNNPQSDDLFSSAPDTMENRNEAPDI